MNETKTAGGREIAEIGEEVALLRGMVILLQSEPGDLTAAVYKRTIARLEALLAEKRKGMR